MEGAYEAAHRILQQLAVPHGAAISARTATHKCKHVPQKLHAQPVRRSTAAEPWSAA